MTKRMPPVPAESQNPKESGRGKNADDSRDLRNKHRQDPHNADEAGDRANIEQNTSNQRSG